jgi:hypothetical protein
MLSYCYIYIFIQDCTRDAAYSVLIVLCRCWSFNISPSGAAGPALSLDRKINHEYDDCECMVRGRNSTSQYRRSKKSHEAIHYS